MPEPIEVSIPFAAGRLAGSLYIEAGPLVVAVHGSGPCDRESPHVAARVHDLRTAGLSVLVYDKPGCGASGGDWTRQSLQQRGEEVSAAAAFAREHPAVGGRPVTLVGQSQGGWVSLTAAAGDPQIPALVTTSGPGVRVADQEIYRLGHDYPRLGLSAAESRAAVEFLRRRMADIQAGRTVEEIFERELAWSLAPWRPAIGAVSMDELAFEVGVYLYDPAADLRALRVPVLGVFGGADRVIPVGDSIESYLENLTECDPRSRLLVVPNVGHGLRDNAGAAPPGLWESIARWLVDVTQDMEYAGDGRGHPDLRR